MCTQMTLGSQISSVADATGKVPSSFYYVTWNKLVSGSKLSVKQDFEGLFVWARLWQKSRAIALILWVTVKNNRIGSVQRALAQHDRPKGA